MTNYCSWIRGGHQMEWKPATWVAGFFIQYGTCAVCGIAKARETLR